jgi:hypothetical protein
MLKSLGPICGSLASARVNCILRIKSSVSEDAAMPEVSQRTFGKLIEALSTMYAAHKVSSTVRFNDPMAFWRTKLFEYQFPEWLSKVVGEWSADWTSVVPQIRSGVVVSYKEINIGTTIGYSILLRLIAMVLQEPNHPNLIEQLRRSLQLDGFDFANQQLLPIDTPISAENEKNALLAMLKQSKIGRKDIISKHIIDAQELFTAGKHHPAINEGRSAFQAIIEEVVTLAETKFSRRSGAGLKNQAEFLEQNGVLSADERAAVLSAWGFLSSGSHPGLSQEEHGRIGTIFSLEFCQIMLVKCRTLL